jgi:hypothetical protein
MGEVMKNEQVMQLMADIGLHEGGMNNWVPDNAWVQFANLVEAHERKFIAEQWEKWYGHDLHGVAEFVRKIANTQEEQR